MTLDNMPGEMKEVRQWLTWSMEGDRKIPKTTAGDWAKTNEPDCFSSFNEVVAASDKIAFVIQGDDPFVGVDLDNCLDEKGELREWAQPIAMKLDGVSYAEVSPSGNGIKFITRGSKEPGSRCVKRFDDGKQQVECYDFNRFWTITGNVYADNRCIGDGQPAIDWLVEKYLTPEPAAPVTTSATRDLPMFDDHRKVEQASAYLATIEGAISGQGGHNALYRAAVKMLEGFDLGNEQAYQLLAGEFNQRCVPPWSEGDLRRKVDQARKVAGQQNAIGYLLEPLPTVDDSIGDEVDFSVMIERASPDAIGDPEPTDLIPDPGPMPEALLQPAGWLGEIAEHTNATSLKPQPNFALAGAIALGATILGRRVADQFGGRTNLYIVTVAETGSGKERSRSVNAEILERAIVGPAKENHPIGPEEWASPQGLLTDLAARGVAYYPIDEFGHMLQAASGEKSRGPLAGLGSILLKLWSNAPTRYRGSAYAAGGKAAGKGVEIDQPHCVVFGTTTGRTFYDALSSREVADGLLNRVLIVETEDKYPFEPDEIGTGPVPESIIDAMRWWHEYSPGGNLGTVTGEPTKLEFSSDAAARLKSHRRAITETQRTEEPDRAALWSRTGEKASKVAMIHACSRQRVGIPTVEIGDVEYGVALSNYLTRKMVFAVQSHVSDSTAEANTKAIVRTIRELGGVASRSEITSRWHRMGKQPRDEAIQTLVEGGTLAEFTDGTGRSAKTCYRLTGQ